MIGRPASVLVEYKGEKVSIPQLSRISGISIDVLRRRILSKQMTVNDALSKRVKGSTPQRISPHGYVVNCRKGYKQLEHIEIAEKILGYKPSSKIVVHHINGDGTNNSYDNLVICENQAYHALLHYRQRALEESGNANNRKCVHCKQWDRPENMKKRSNRAETYHQECNNKASREYRAWKKQYEMK